MLIMASDHKRHSHKEVDTKILFVKIFMWLDSSFIYCSTNLVKGDHVDDTAGKCQTVHETSQVLIHYTIIDKKGKPCIQHDIPHC